MAQQQADALTLLAETALHHGIDPGAQASDTRWWSTSTPPGEECVAAFRRIIEDDALQWELRSSAFKYFEEHIAPGGVHREDQNLHLTPGFVTGMTLAGRCIPEHN